MSNNMTSASYPEQLQLFTLHQILDEENSKHASLTSQNGFASAFLHMMLRRAKRLIKA
jgi:hypothetical protein